MQIKCEDNRVLLEILQTYNGAIFDKSEGEFSNFVAISEGFSRITLALVDEFLLQIGEVLGGQ